MSMRPTPLLLALIGAILVGLAGPASADVIDELGNAIPVESADAILEASGLDRLAARADYIVHARVGAQTAAWVNKNIETSSIITVENKLKGEGPDRFELTVLGGDAPDNAPIGQYVRGAARVFEGEEVILFLNTDTEQRVNEINERRMASGLQPMRISPASKLATSFRVVGGMKGKFNVVTLADGSKYVTRFRPMPQMLSKPVLDVMMSELRKDLTTATATPEERRAAVRAEWDAAADQWEGEFGVRPILPGADYEPGSLEPVREPLAAGASAPLVPRSLPLGGAKVAPEAAEGPGGLPREAYRPSIVTDPEAPEFAAEKEETLMKVLPHNADFHRRPMALDLFESLVRYQVRREAEAASPVTASAEAN